MPYFNWKNCLLEERVILLDLFPLWGPWALRRVRFPGRASSASCRVHDIAVCMTLVTDSLYQDLSIGPCCRRNQPSKWPFGHKAPSTKVRMLKFRTAYVSAFDREKHHNEGFRHVFWGLWEEKLDAFCPSSERSASWELPLLLCCTYWYAAFRYILREPSVSVSVVSVVFWRDPISILLIIRRKGIEKKLTPPKSNWNWNNWDARVIGHFTFLRLSFLNILPSEVGMQ